LVVFDSASTTSTRDSSLSCFILGVILASSALSLASRFPPLLLLPGVPLPLAAAAAAAAATSARRRGDNCGDCGEDVDEDEEWWRWWFEDGVPGGAALPPGVSGAGGGVEHGGLPGAASPPSDPGPSPASAPPPSRSSAAEGEEEDEAVGLPPAEDFLELMGAEMEGRRELTRRAWGAEPSSLSPSSSSLSLLLRWWLLCRWFECES
jgi:hypothetical protein